MGDSVEVTRLMQALDAFEEAPGGQLPEGVGEAIGNLRQAFKPAEDPRLTPGQRAAVEAQSSYGTGVPLKHAATGADRPTPGQKAARGISDDIRDRAQRIVAEHTE